MQTSQPHVCTSVRLWLCVRSWFQAALGFGPTLGCVSPRSTICTASYRLVLLLLLLQRCSDTPVFNTTHRLIGRSPCYKCAHTQQHGDGSAALVSVAGIQGKVMPMRGDGGADSTVNIRIPHDDVIF